MPDPVCPYMKSPETPPSIAPSTSCAALRWYTRRLSSASSNACRHGNRMCRTSIRFRSGYIWVLCTVHCWGPVTVTTSNSSCASSWGKSGRLRTKTSTLAESSARGWASA